VNSWHFQGQISSSKSLFNRALIAQSYFPELRLKGFSQADDVRFMRQALQNIPHHQEVDAGEGGTTFRFLALRWSREPGSHFLKGEPRLMQRPQAELVSLCQQLGVQAEIKTTGIALQSSGWKRPSAPVQVDSRLSSQYASALVLNAWNLDFALEFELTGEKVSESYFLMTLAQLQQLGMRVQKTPRGYLIPAGQKVSCAEMVIEPDLSSAFAIAVAGYLAGDAIIENFPQHSLQPDRVFLDILRAMKISYDLDDQGLHIAQGPRGQAVEWSLAQCPDLFPVLAVLCSVLRGRSKLYGAPHLAQKESHRIHKVAELLSLAGIVHEVRDDGMIIEGSILKPNKNQFSFNPDKDHRMVMAAALLKLLGFAVHIENPEAVNKSFPEFWQILGIQP